MQASSQALLKPTAKTVSTSKVWLRQEQAAAHIGLAPPTLEKMRFRGDGPAYSKIGRVVVYDRDLLDEWVTSRTINSTSQNPVGRKSR
ncbi:MAG: helix-turn-helix domain-containing protein [Magnetococcales bacterium]|nr:helix-turn-helix domain-containing protein [Magnetococcales bacterium]